MTRFFTIYWGAAAMVAPLFIFFGKLPLIPYKYQARWMAFFGTVRYSKDLFLLGAALICLVLGYRSSLPKPVKLLTLTGLVLAFFHKQNYLSVTFTQQFIYLGFYAVLAGLFWVNSRKKDLDIYLDCILGAGVVQALMVCCDFDLTQLFVPRGTVKHITNVITLPTGTMGNTNVTGAFIALCLPAAFRKNRVIFAPLLLGALLIMKARGGLLAGACGIIYLYMIGHSRKLSSFPRYAAPFFLCSSVLAAFFAPRVYDSGRFEMWFKSIEQLTIKKLLIGGGTAFVPDNPLLWTKWKRLVPSLHNEYLEIFINYGVLGFILFTAILYLSPKKKNNNLSAIVLVGIVSMSYHFTMHQLTTGMIFVSALFYNEVKE